MLGGICYDGDDDLVDDDDVLHLVRLLDLDMKRNELSSCLPVRLGRRRYVVIYTGNSLD